MEERIYSRFVNLPKIPYTNAGIAIIEAEVRAQLQEAVTAGVIDGEQAIIVTVPKISQISVNDRANRINDRANRILPAITFEAKLAGAIHKATVRGTVTV
jgi:predicted exporter